MGYKNKTNQINVYEYVWQGCWGILSVADCDLKSPCSEQKRRMKTSSIVIRLCSLLQPLKLRCELCSIVSSSGQMLGQAAGPQIDRSPCIWRMNNAPTRGFEDDVGRRTTLRVVSHTSVPLLLQKPQYFFGQANDTVYVVWGPLRNMRKDGKGIVYNMLRQASENYPNARIYITTEDRMNYCDMVFKKETGKDRWAKLQSLCFCSCLSLKHSNLFLFLAQHSLNSTTEFHFITLTDLPLSSLQSILCPLYVNLIDADGQLIALRFSFFKSFLSWAFIKVNPLTLTLKRF